MEVIRHGNIGRPKLGRRSHRKKHEGDSSTKGRMRPENVENENLMHHPKIWKSAKGLASNISFKNNESKITRGHCFTLVKEQSRLYVRKYSCSQRIINVWNKLSTDCVHASSDMFKNRIEKYLIKAGYT